MSDQRQVRSAFVSTALFLSMGFAHNVGGAIPHFSFWSVLLWVSTFLLLSKKERGDPGIEKAKLLPLIPN